MAQQLRSLVVLAKDPGLILNIHMVLHRLLLLQFQRIQCPSGLHGLLGYVHVVHIHTQAYKYTHKINIFQITPETIMVVPV